MDHKIKGVQNHDQIRMQLNKGGLRKLNHDHAVPQVNVQCSMTKDKGQTTDLLAAVFKAIS